MTNVTAHDTMSSRAITLLAPQHPVYYPTYAAMLADNMRVNGWVGEPIVVVDLGNECRLVTGVHRQAALEILDSEGIKMDVPVVYASVELYEGMDYGMDEDDMASLATMYGEYDVARCFQDGDAE